jgi:hypothetical protein
LKNFYIKRTRHWPILNFAPRGKLRLLGEKFCHLGVRLSPGVKFSVRPSILLNSTECSPLGVNEGVSIPPREQSSSLGVKFTMLLKTGLWMPGIILVLLVSKFCKGLFCLHLPVFFMLRTILFISQQVSSGCLLFRRELKNNQTVVQTSLTTTLLRYFRYFYSFDKHAWAYRVARFFTTHQYKKKYTKWPQNYQMAIIRKIDKISIKNTHIFHCKTLQNLPK